MERFLKPIWLPWQEGTDKSFALQLHQKLPALVQAVQQAGQTVTWICDPMHGNTESCNGVKTRRYENIRSEVLSICHCSPVFNLQVGRLDEPVSFSRAALQSSLGMLVLKPTAARFTTNTVTGISNQQPQPAHSHLI